MGQRFSNIALARAAGIALARAAGIALACAAGIAHARAAGIEASDTVHHCGTVIRCEASDIPCVITEELNRQVVGAARNLFVRGKRKWLQK